MTRVITENDRGTVLLSQSFIYNKSNEVKKMPRHARRKSESGVYHVILRGINQQIIFEDEEDNLKFIGILKTYKSICRYNISAYCLMQNHLHLLLKVNDENQDSDNIGTIIKRIACSYAYWFNMKYNRTGHLFQDRFKSEVVENDSYFMTVLRYIHENPIKAGLCDNLDGYRYSSFNDYENGDSSLIDISFTFSIMNMKQFVEFHREHCNYNGFDSYTRSKRLNDINATAIIIKLFECESSTELQTYEKERRNRALKVLNENGLSIRQLNRLTGVSKGVIERARRS